MKLNLKSMALATLTIAALTAMGSGCGEVKKSKAGNDPMEVQGVRTFPLDQEITAAKINMFFWKKDAEDKIVPGQVEKMVVLVGQRGKLSTELGRLENQANSLTASTMSCTVVGHLTCKEVFDYSLNGKIGVAVGDAKGHPGKIVSKLRELRALERKRGDGKTPVADQLLKTIDFIEKEYRSEEAAAATAAASSRAMAAANDSKEDPRVSLLAGEILELAGQLQRARKQAFSDDKLLSAHERVHEMIDLQLKIANTKGTLDFVFDKILETVDLYLTVPAPLTITPAEDGKGEPSIHIKGWCINPKASDGSKCPEYSTKDGSIQNVKYLALGGRLSFDVVLKSRLEIYSFALTRGNYAATDKDGKIYFGGDLTLRDSRDRAVLRTGVVKIDEAIGSDSKDKKDDDAAIAPAAP